MKVKKIGSIVLVSLVIFSLFGTIILIIKDTNRTKKINRDYIETSGLTIISGSVHNRGWNSVYLDVFVYDISDYVELATELNIKTVYLRDRTLTFVADNTIYTAYLSSSDSSIDYTEKGPI